jgi:chromosome segregation ATPase
LVRIGDTDKVVEARSYDIRNRQVNLDDCEKEINRLKDANNGQNIECGALRKDVDRVSTDCYDLKKHIEGVEARNGDLSNQVRVHDMNIKEKEENVYLTKKDIEALTMTNANMRGDLND